MNSSAKLLRVLARLPIKRNVSSIRPRSESVIYNGQTYTKMLHPHTLTSRVVNFPWPRYWENFAWFRMLIYSTILVMPLALYTNFHVFSALYAAKRAAKKAGKTGHH